MIEIQPQAKVNGVVSVPGSKSYTHRIFIAAALSDGVCTVKNALNSVDTVLTMDALKQMGVKFDGADDLIIVHGCNGKPGPSDEPIYLGNSGTSMRLLTGVAAIGRGRYILTGTRRMHERPIQDLLDALQMLDVPAKSLNHNGCPPLEIVGGNIAGGKVDIRCKVSSQYLTALLLIAPLTSNGLEIKVTEGPVSKPYVDMSVDVMRRFGIEVHREGYEHFAVSGNQVYKAGEYVVEPDYSNAGYFWAAAAVTGGTVTVENTRRSSRQGDVRLTELFERMGCRVAEEPDGISVTGGPLKGIETDMSDIPDMVPTLGVVAAFAEGRTVIKNVAHLKAKESDRLSAVATELRKMGVDAQVTDDGLIIQGGHPKGAEIDTYDDHRIAMCFAVAGLKAEGTVIRNERCVEKSFPDYWKVLNRLCKNKE